MSERASIDSQRFSVGLERYECDLDVNSCEIPKEKPRMFGALSCVLIRKWHFQQINSKPLHRHSIFFRTRRWLF